METGDIIKRFRQARGLTQAELAEKVGVRRESISQYESNKIDPPTRTYLKILNILKVKGFENPTDNDFLTMQRNGKELERKTTARKIVEQLLEDNEGMRDMIMQLREKIVALETERNTYEKMYNQILNRLNEKIEK